jgi:hypothetical protein
MKSKSILPTAMGVVSVFAKLILNIIINLHAAFRYNNPAPKSDKSNNLGFFFRKLRF